MDMKTDNDLSEVYMAQSTTCARTRNLVPEVFMSFRKRERICSYCGQGSMAAIAPKAATALSATPASLLMSLSC